MRNITIYSTRGTQLKEINTDVTTFGELIILEEMLEYPMGDLTATESINKSILSNPDSLLPEGDFTLFMRASKKSNAGVTNRKEAYSLLQTYTKEQKEDFKAKTLATFGYSKSYTNMSTEDILTILENNTTSTVVKSETVSASIAPTKINSKKESFDCKESYNVLNARISKLEKDFSNFNVISDTPIVDERAEKLARLKAEAEDIFNSAL